MSDWIGVVTARGGSVGIPGKNLALLGGKPLIVHTVEAALGAGSFARVIINSDDDEILRVGAAAGAEPQQRRPELATSEASSLDVLADALERLGAHGARYALLQPTSPLRNARHLREAVDQYVAGDYRTLVSATRCAEPPQKCLVERNGRIEPILDKAMLTTPRQQLDPAFHVNGAIYLGDVDAFLKTHDLFQEPLGLYAMSPEDSIDIDVPEDLSRAEILLERQVDRGH